jgi:hypothetical protein
MNGLLGGKEAASLHKAGSQQMTPFFAARWTPAANHSSIRKTTVEKEQWVLLSFHLAHVGAERSRSTGALVPM